MDRPDQLERPQGRGPPQRPALPEARADNPPNLNRTAVFLPVPRKRVIRQLLRIKGRSPYFGRKRQFSPAHLVKPARGRGHPIGKTGS